MSKWFYIAGIVLIIGIVGSISDACSNKEKESDGKSLTEMLDENDFKSANGYVNNIYNNISKQGSYKQLELITEKYLPAAIQTLKAEASYLMDQDDPEAEKLFMLCLNDVSGNIGKYQVTLGIYDESINDMYKITEEITPYNICLLAIIKEALIKEKPDFAKKVFKMMKKNYKCEKKLKEGKSGFFDSHYTYDYKEDNSQIEEAQILLSEF